MKLTLRIVLCMLTVVLLAVACVFPASANSAVRYWEGSAAHGVVSGNGQCPITVLHETLTFDIPHFPDDTYDSYAAKVTAEYTLHNPSETDVTVKLAFPFGQRPSYSNFEEVDSDADQYGITLDGQAVEAGLRHTYVYGPFDLSTDLLKLRDGYSFSQLLFDIACQETSLFTDRS